VAQQYFQLVGSSASECDTIPGRQCMASFFFLSKTWDEVALYLKSIKVRAGFLQPARSPPLTTYAHTHGRRTFTTTTTSTGTLACPSARRASSQRPRRRSCRCRTKSTAPSSATWPGWPAAVSAPHVGWEGGGDCAGRSLTLCLVVRNGKPRQAWELYMKLESNAEALNLLQVVANECYKIGAPVRCPPPPCCLTPVGVSQAPSTTRPRRSTCWRVSIPTRTFGRASAAPVWCALLAAAPFVLASGTHAGTAAGRVPAGAGGQGVARAAA
jgi:hypothetical protein